MSSEEVVQPETLVDDKSENKPNNENMSSSVEVLHRDNENVSDTTEVISETQTEKEESKTEEKTEEIDSKPEQLNTITSRELKSLLELSKEANLDTNIAYKRKSIEPGKLMDKQETRNSSSSNSDARDSAAKRSMRSQNPEFVAKHHKFLSRLSTDMRYPGLLVDTDEKFSKEVLNKQKKKENCNEATIGGAIDGSTRKLLKPVLTMIQNNKDGFCWRCHRDKVIISCGTCCRSYHTKCLKQSTLNTERWVCPECVTILKAESTKTRSPAMKDLPLEHFCGLLKFALKRMMQCSDSDPFIHPVNEIEFPDYKKYIVQPMDLTKLEKNIKENLYGSTVAFEADAKWMLHNSIIFNSYQSKLTTIAKSIIKICKQEMAEIENCANCYLNANTRKDWFVEVCPKPHILLWAKLKGFPYWPAKGMMTNSQGMVDVRFFGAHDRAWVPFKECFLFSQKDPNSNKQKRNDINECIKELEIHIENLRKIYGEFNYAAYRTPYDPEMETEQLQIFLPTYKSDCKIINESGKTETNNECKKSSSEITMKPDTDSENFTKSDTDLNRSYISETASKYSSDSDNSRDLYEKLDMDGYGTDDECDSKIYRRICHIENNENNIDDEDIDFDTQVETNSVADSRREGIKVGHSNNTDGIHVTPKQLSEAIKRISTDINSESPQKKARRNSDHSVKSDSSRLSNISDKINKVNMSEDMEITLVNDAGDVNITENISPHLLGIENNSECSEVTAEQKKKPVQVNMTNKEFSISPQSKCKIADKLMKKLTESDKENSESLEIETVKKQINTNCETNAQQIVVDSNTYSEKDRVEIHSLESSITDIISEKDITESESEPSIIHINQVILGDATNLKRIEILVNKNSDNENLEVTSTKQDLLMKHSTVDQGILTSYGISSVNMEKGDQTNEMGGHSSNQSDNIVKETKEVSTLNNSDDLLEEMYSEIEDTEIDKSLTNKINLSNSNLVQQISIANQYEKLKSSGGNSEDPKKRKCNSEFNSTQIHKKLVKLVNFEELKKTLDDKISLCKKEGSLLQKQLEIDKNISKNNEFDIITLEKEKCNDNDNINLVKIKSEPNSEEEIESDYMEAKRQYLSALNISEKVPDGEKNKQNEIKTRSRTEDRTKLKVIDNLTKIIDKVASNFSDENIETVMLKKDKIPIKETYVKILPKTALKQKARKSFPKSTSLKTIYPNKNEHKLVKSLNNLGSGVSSSITSTVSKSSSGSETQSLGNVLFLTQPQSTVNNITVLPPNQTIAYSTNMGSPVLTMVQHTPVQTPFTNVIIPSSAINSPLPAANAKGTEQESQNYIPQNENSSDSVICNSHQSAVNISQSATQSTSLTNSLVNNTTVTGIANGQAVLHSSTNSNRSQAVSDLNDDINLSGFAPENITKAITDIMCRGPPKLKPRPPGPLSTNFDPGVPSSAGIVATHINSIAHRLNDYLRGMLIETLNDIGSTEHPQSLIATLRLENETLRQRHSEEIIEIKKNINSILRDLQKSVSEEKDRLVEETRAVCEAETLKRVEEAKSKQWCANCMKEAQFYCCWNTSYCDYPCQLKHWPKHMSKCTQNSGSNPQPLNNNSSPKASVQHPLFLRKTVAPKTFPAKTLITKQTKIIAEKAGVNKVPVGLVKSSGAGTLTIVEPTPGSYELVGNGPISVGGKIINPTVLNKIKPGNIITVTSSSNLNSSSGGINTTTQKFIITQTKSPVVPKPATTQDTD